MDNESCMLIKQKHVNIRICTMMSITDTYANFQNFLKEVNCYQRHFAYRAPIILHAQCLIPSGYTLEFASKISNILTKKGPIIEGCDNVIRWAMGILY